MPVSQWSLFSQGRSGLKEVRSGDEEDTSERKEGMSGGKEVRSGEEDDMKSSGNEKGKSGEEEGV